MVVINDILSSKIDFEDTYVAIGNFDGVHYGHEELIRETVNKAHANNKMAVVFTFANHPLEVLKKETKFNYIGTIEEKLYLMEKLGVDCIIAQILDENFLEYTPLEFVRILKNKLKVREIFVGFNFSFGKDGIGRTSDLKYLGEIYGIEVTEVPPITIENELVSSSLIRRKILNSDFDGAIKYLGHPMLVIGKVIHGRKIARKLGFPTANIEVKNRLYPPFGIYGAYVKIENRKEFFYGVVNVGLNPTLKSGELSLEVHLLDFDEDIYDKKLYIEIVKFMREERKFSSVDELKATIQNDVNNWRKHKREMEDGSFIKNR